MVLPDPRTHRRQLVKRVAAVSQDGVSVAGDNEAASTDSRTFGPVGRAQISGRVLYRYAPPARAGRIKRSLHRAGDSARPVPLR